MFFISKDPNGNFIIIELIISGEKITLVNIYGPNDDKPQIYSNVQPHVSELNDENITLYGD